MRSSVWTHSANALNRKTYRPTGGWRAASRLVLAAVIVAPLLTACGNGGLRPLYGAAGIGGAQADARLAKVSVTTIPGRVGQQIRNELIFHATGGGGEVVQPDMRLEVAIRESVTSTLVRVDGDSGGQVFTFEAKFVRNSASSTAVLPPPITATSLSRKKNPSQVAHADKP